MDKRFVKILLIMIGSAISILAVGLGIKQYMRAEANYIPDQIRQADEFIECGQGKRAAELLLTLQNADAKPDQRQQIADRLAKLTDSIAELEEDRAYRDERRRLQAERNRLREGRIAEAKRERLEPFGGPIIGIAMGVGLMFGGCMMIGSGQIFVAVRDIAINSYVLTRGEPFSLPRTPPSVGSIAPRYRSIRILAMGYYLTGGLQIAAGSGVVLFVVANL